MTALPLLGAASLAFVAWFTWHQFNRPDAGSGQSRRQSIIEAWVNIVIGFSVNAATNTVLFPLMVGVHVSAEANFWGGWIYTAISVLRQFAIRRWFNTHEMAGRLARWIG